MAVAAAVVAVVADERVGALQQRDELFLLLADALRRLQRDAQRVVVLCGPIKSAYK